MHEATNLTIDLFGAAGEKAASVINALTCGGVATIGDLAGSTSDEVIELLEPLGLTRDDCDVMILIMRRRLGWIGTPAGGVVEFIVGVIGPNATQSLLEAVGGVRVYFPARIDKVGDDHWLVRSIGRESARKLCAALAQTGADHDRPGTRQRGVRIEIPSAKVKRASPITTLIAEATRRGVSAREIALTTGLTERAVRRNRAAARGFGLLAS
jgi:hypothetical protein